MGSRCLSIKASNKESVTTITNNNLNIIDNDRHNEPNSNYRPIDNKIEISFFYFTIYKLKKTKILDPNIKSYITCPICEQNIDNQIVLPRNLPCGHTLCNICVVDIKKKADEKYKCPFDRQEIEMNSFIPVSSFLLEINGCLPDPKKHKNFMNLKTEMKIRSIAFDSMKTILYNRKYKSSNLKKYLEFIASEIKDKIKILDNYENYLNFSIVVFLFHKDVKFSFNGTCYKYFNDEIHFIEEYKDEEWKCVTFLFVHNTTNLKLVQDSNRLESYEITNIQKQCSREIEKVLNGAKTLDELIQDKHQTFELCENIKNNVLKDIKSYYSFSVDCLISNTKAEENGRFGGFFKKNEILRIPIKQKYEDLNCLVNISCFKTI